MTQPLTAEQIKGLLAGWDGDAGSAAKLFMAAHDLARTALSALAERDALAAEVARLKGALKTMDAHWTAEYDMTDSRIEASIWNVCRNAARAALEVQP